MNYNYGDSILESESYKKFLLDYTLTYVDYWNDRIKHPSEKIAIRNPYFYDRIEKI